MSTDPPELYRLDLNPEPWAVGPAGVNRSGGGMRPFIGRNQQLWNYQQAVKESLLHDYPSKPVCTLGQPMVLDVWFWREVAEYTTPQSRRARKHEADVTNLLKGFEDALQGIFFDNDKDVREGTHCLVEQGPGVQGLIIFRCYPARYQIPVLPLEVMQLQYREDEDDSNVWPPKE